MAFISNVDSSILPYNDSNANYDIDKRRYILTQTGLKELVGIDVDKYVSSPQEKDDLLDEFSLDVYDFVYDHTLISSIKYKRFKMAKANGYREVMLEAMAMHARGSLRSGLFLLKDQHGVNIEKGKVIDLSNLRGEVTLAGSAYRVLRRGKLLYNGNVYDNDYVDDGTY